MNTLQRIGVAALFVLSSAVALASDAKPAAELLKTAHAKAKSEKKNVFVVFDASW